MEGAHIYNIIKGRVPRVKKRGGGEPSKNLFAIVLIKHSRNLTIFYHYSIHANIFVKHTLNLKFETFSEVPSSPAGQCLISYNSHIMGVSCSTLL